MADSTISRPRKADPTGISVLNGQTASDPLTAKCMRAFALLEEAWELIHDVLDNAGEAGTSNPMWQARIPAVFPEEAVHPLGDAICLMRPAENFPVGTTRAEMEAAVEGEGAGRH